MKNLFLSLAMLSLAAIAFTGCSAPADDAMMEEDAAMEEVVEPDVAVDAVVEVEAMEEAAEDAE